MAHPMQEKAYQQEKRKPACPIKGEAQEKERRLRRVEEEEVVHVAKPREAQQGWKRSSVEELKKRAEEHCGKGVPEEYKRIFLGLCLVT